MRHISIFGLCGYILAGIQQPAPLAAQTPVGTGAFSICVVSHDASNTFYASKLSKGGNAATGTEQFNRYRNWLVKNGKADAADAGNCYYNDDGQRIGDYVEHLDDGCDNCATWTIVYTDWTPDMGQ
jgi:hypothetical protein